MYACTDFDYSSPESAQSAKRNVVKGLGSEVDEETKSDLNSILLLILELGLPKKMAFGLFSFSHVCFSLFVGSVDNTSWMNPCGLIR